MDQEAQSVYEFWYKPGNETKDNMKVWFGSGKEGDDEIREKFGSLIEKARNGELKSWEDHPQAAFAHIILIDQFCRSIYRGSPKAFDCDHISMAIAKKLVAVHLKSFNPTERFFIYLPIEHSENLDDQNLSCKLYADMAEEYKGTDFESFCQNGVTFSQEHREVIKKCGRFPKRNAVLGRENTPEEEEFLKNYPYKF